MARWDVQLLALKSLWVDKGTSTFAHAQHDGCNQRCLIILLLLGRVRVCSSITAAYSTRFAAAPFQLTLYFLLDNRVCNMPYGECEQGLGSSLSAELLLSSLPWRQEWLCKDHSTQPSFQRKEETNFRLNNTNKFSPAEGLRPQEHKLSSFCLVTHQETKPIIQQP